MYKKAQATSQLDVATGRIEEIQSVAFSLLSRDWRLAQLNYIETDIERRYARDGRGPLANLVALLDEAINDVEASTRTPCGPVPQAYGHAAQLPIG